ncbi:MarR family winged helix-turn-helix transcriptional regulator [Nocardioides sp. SYSU DS0651]|uniref:MarR family winged helix-turn-helix transcriptional regulator n=1 Tax=Nocardioides sp. SYSU DS0651 TaxID=3415955 RepID=UPI003F4BF7A3
MEDSTADMLMGAARVLRRRYAAALEKYDVTPAQSRALRVVGEHPEARLSQIADALRIAPRSATEVVDALEGRGLVRRIPDPSDRRATCVDLTADGRRVLRVIDRTRRAESERFLAGLPQEERSQLDRILRRLVS